MALNDLTDQNIQDTYQKVVQTEGTNLADGTGSLLPISFDGNNVIISGSLTAQTYVVSESIINVTSGSTMFGNSSDDTHTFTGNIITSGTINATSFTLSEDISVRNITASGDISSSGNITTPAINLLGIPGSSNPTINFGTNGDRIYYQDDTISIAPNDSDVLTISDLNPGGSSNVIVSGDLKVTSHVTASGNISSSGEVYADRYHVEGKQAIDYICGLTTIAYGQNNQTALLRGKTVQLGGDNTQHVTASGNISSSGEITSDRLKVLGTVPSVITSGLTIGSDSPANVNLLVDGNSRFESHITASGNISASGTSHILGGDLTVYGRFRALGSTFDTLGGNITASGNISSSGNIETAHTGSFNHIVTSGQTIEFKDGSTKLGAIKMTSEGDMTIEDATTGKSKLKISDLGVTNSSGEVRIQNGHITASGNISSSGLIQATNGFYAGASTRFVATGTDTAAIQKNDGSSLTSLQLKANQITGQSGFVINANNLLINHITASGDISSSGGIITQHITASGNISGSAAGTVSAGSGSFHVLKGDTTAATGLSVAGYIEATNITASGNISASGFIDTDQYRIQGNKFALPVTGQNDIFSIGEAGDSSLTLTNITASGNISASGNVIANKYYIQNQSLDDIFAPKTSVGLPYAAAASVVANSATASFAITSSNVLFGHITASGNISASGNILSTGYIEGAYFNSRTSATGFKLNGAKYLWATSGDLQVGNVAADTDIIGTSINLNAHVTASGNISSSGDLFGTNLTVAAVTNTDRLIVDQIDAKNEVGLRIMNDITASGAISSSGDIIAPNIGYHGNDEFIPILPTDFDGNAQAGRYSGVIVVNNGGYGGHSSYASVPSYAVKIIPKGFTAITGSVYGGVITNTVRWYSSSLSVDTSAILSEGWIEASTGTGSAFTNAVVGDGSTYVVVEWDAASGNAVFGGKIYIERT